LTRSGELTSVLDDDAQDYEKMARLLAMN